MMKQFLGEIGGGKGRQELIQDNRNIMVVILGNQKGGAGKSTIALLLANYLSSIKNRRVTVLDMDYQQSLVSVAEKAKLLANKPDYEIIPSDLKHFPVLLKILNKNKSEIVIIDLPGKMDDDGLISVFKAADVIICPFNYDEFSVNSTLLFAMVTQKINKQAKFVFIPNRIKRTVKYNTKIEVNKVLHQFGAIAPTITERVDFQRINTAYIPAILLPEILPVLDTIYEEYFIRKEENN